MPHALRDGCLYRIAMLANARSHARRADEQHPLAAPHRGGKRRRIIEIRMAHICTTLHKMRELGRCAGEQYEVFRRTGRQ